METVPLYFDADAYSQPNRCLLANGTDARLTTSFAFTAGDQFTLALYPRTKSTVHSEITVTKRFTPGATIVVTGKLTTALGAATLLFKAQTFTEDNTANDDSGDWFYTGFLDLFKTELLAAFTANNPAGNTPYLQVMLMIVVTDPDTTVKRWLANIVVYNPGYLGNEGDPTDATASNYLTTEQIAAGYIPQAPANGAFRMKVKDTGTFLQYWNGDTELWHILFPAGQAGALITAWGPGEI